MKTLLLVHHDPDTIGGYQTLSKSLKDALEADVWNVRTKPKPDFDDYDYFVAMDDISGYELPLKRPHTYYMLTPRRSAYDMYHHTPRYVRPLIWLYRPLDRRFVKHVKDIVTISHNTRNRINKFYNRDAKVIYPCIDADAYSWEPEEDYWLAVQRIDKWKRIDLIIDAFRDMPDENLCMFGDLHKNYHHLIYTMPRNVVWETGGGTYLKKKYARCKGVIQMGIDEDFGIVPLEAMASGKHVIAPFEGGYIESLLGVGDLIYPTKESLIAAVKRYRSDLHSPEHCKEMAREFDCSVFKDQWRKHANFILSNYEQLKGSD